MKLNQIKQLCKTKYLPIIRPESQKIVCQILKESKAKRILEIGTFYGYSGSVMLLSSPNAHLITIEKDAQNAEIAMQTFVDEKLVDRVRLIQEDALVALEKLVLQGEKFDFIFLDGAKGQYYKYFAYIKSLLEVGGTLVADDVDFHGYMIQNQVKHKHRTIVNNLKKFIKLVTDDESFESKILNIEDGLLIARKTK